MKRLKRKIAITFLTVITATPGLLLIPSPVHATSPNADEQAWLNTTGHPFASGQKWCVVQGYNTSSTHGTGYPNQRYALDLVKDNISSRNEPVYAVADGYAYSFNIQNGGKGIRLYKNSNYTGYNYQYDHINADSLNSKIGSGQLIKKGEQLGTVFRDAPLGGWYHLHFDLEYGTSEPIPLNYGAFNYPANGATNQYNGTCIIGGDNVAYRHYFADLNGDGADDLIQISTNVGMWIALADKNTGSLNVWNYYTDQVGELNGVNKHYFVKLNNDNAYDLVQVNKNVGMWTAMADPLTGNLSVWSSYTDQVGELNGANKHYFADISGDGSDDLIQISSNVGMWTGITNRTTGSINVWSSYTNQVGALNGANKHYFAKLNSGDFAYDLIQISSNVGMWTAIATPGTGALNVWSTYTNQVGGLNGANNHYFADINGDLSQDLIQISSNVGMWTGLTNPFSGAISVWTTYTDQVGQLNGTNRHYFTKLNSDNAYDLIQVNKNVGLWTAFANPNTGGFNVWTSYTDQVGELNGTNKHYFARLNNDSSGDIIQIARGRGLWTGLTAPTTGSMTIWSSFTDQVGF